MSNEIAVKDQQVQVLTLADIKKYICPMATDQEAYMFLQLCQSQGLNPFLREAYLIKYGNERAAMVIGKEAFTKRADKIADYSGFKAGIIIQSADKIQYREGSFVVSGETLLGGWAEVFRKGREKSFRNEVSMQEYARKKNTGEYMRNWADMPATMIRKVALVQSLREAFPDEFGGIYSPEEMPIDSASLPTYEHGKEIAIQHPEITPPQSKSGKTPQTTEPPPAEKVHETETAGILKTDPLQIETVEQKKGEKDGKRWTLYFVTAGGQKYSTFSETHAKTAKTMLQGKTEAIIEYEPHEKRRNLKNVYPAAAQEPDPDGCTKNPVTCDGSSWMGTKDNRRLVCAGGIACKYFVEGGADDRDAI